VLNAPAPVRSPLYLKNAASPECSQPCRWRHLPSSYKYLSATCRSVTAPTSVVIASPPQATSATRAPPCMCRLGRPEGRTRRPWFGDALGFAHLGLGLRRHAACRASRARVVWTRDCGRRVHRAASGALEACWPRRAAPGFPHDHVAGTAADACRAGTADDVCCVTRGSPVATDVAGLLACRDRR
jgi:hypothetical protein